MSIVDFPPPPGPPDLLVGPFQQWRVVVDGRAIPHLTGFREGDDLTCLVLDDRFSVSIPNDLARGVAYMLANALAIGAGYSHLGATSKDMPFAPLCSQIGPGDVS